jgi:amino-acid N-acetyltransferase
MESYEITSASAADWDAIQGLLSRSGLPVAGLEPHLKSTIVARDPNGILGCAALELYGDDALLRSVAVAPDRRSEGIGVALAAAAVALARQHRVLALYLLTETAEDFFRRLGFEGVSRDTVPASIRQSEEFASACPESAAVMLLRLRRP